MSVAVEEWPRRHRITVDEYRRMAESGSFAPDARVELLDGVIIDTPPIGSSLGGTVSRLDALLHRATGDRAIVRCQQPVQMGEYSEPEPDLALVATRASFYTDRHPTERDTLLIIEVSDSTLQDNLRQKVTLYARHGIEECWVVDLVNHRLHVFRNPIAGNYAQALAVNEPGMMDIPALHGISVDLTSLFRDS